MAGLMVSLRDHRQRDGNSRDGNDDGQKAFQDWFLSSGLFLTERTRSHEVVD